MEYLNELVSVYNVLNEEYCNQHKDLFEALMTSEIDDSNITYHLSLKIEENYYLLNIIEQFKKPISSCTFCKNFTNVCLDTKLKTEVQMFLKLLNLKKKDNDSKISVSDSENHSDEDSTDDNDSDAENREIHNETDSSSDTEDGGDNW